MSISAPLFLFLMGLVACDGDDSQATAADASARAAAVPDALIQASWQVRMADAAVRQPFEGQEGWSMLFTRQHDAALRAFAAAGGEGRGLARVHLEYAALYRQAALLGARATVEVYGADRQDVDPAQVDYLVMASAALLGDCDTARSASAALVLPEGSALSAPAAYWRSALDACPALPPAPPSGTFPGQPPSIVQAGQIPDVGTLPHYLLIEQTEDAREVSAADPTVLFLLSRWHEQAALAAAPESDAPVIALMLAPWALPAEPAPAVELQIVPDDWLFAGFALTAEDAGFLAQAASGGISAVDAWKDRSPLAAAVAPAVRDGKIDPDSVLDAATAVGRQVQDGMAAKAGQAEDFHRSFADLAMLSTLRAGQIVADANDQYRDAGILRINALERSTGPGADPVFTLSVAAWDTGNRNPLRAQDILHGLLGRFPAVQAARYPLDALHIRLSRNAGPASPAH